MDITFAQKLLLYGLDIVLGGVAFGIAQFVAHRTHRLIHLGCGIVMSVVLFLIGWYVIGSLFGIDVWERTDMGGGETETFAGSFHVVLIIAISFGTLAGFGFRVDHNDK